MHHHLGRILLSLCCSVLIVGNSLAAPLNLTQILNKKMETLSPDLPRYQKLPLFNPHRKTFECVYQAQHIPPIDPESQKWALEAMALDNPDVRSQPNVDYTQKIFELYKKAAERKNWQALHNLAAFVAGKEQQLHLPADAAVRIVEEGMKLGIPDAYDQMGVFHASGLVKGGDATSAYALFQKAADMGSPNAQAYLGRQLAANWDAPSELQWNNMAIGIKMLKCAFAQGNGTAALYLGSNYEVDHTKEHNKLALMYYHQGVKFGNADCAAALGVIFRQGQSVAPLGVDEARGERYSKIGRMLRWYHNLVKLPNLDKVLPLPPAKLPVWDGDKHSLFNAAKAVVPVNNSKAKPTRGSKLEGRAHIPQGYAVNREPTGQPFYENTRVPKSAYWLPVLQLSQLSGGQWANEPYYRFNAEQVPLFFKEGEAFSIDDPRLDAGSPRLLWFYLGVAQAIPEAEPGLLDLLAKYGQARAVDFSAEKLTCTGEQTCPKTGIWQATAEAEHPLAVIYNAWDRQSFVEENQPFPEPQESGLDIKAEQVSWSYIGQQNADKGETGIKEITL